jgi:predicted nucleotidyltransferase component of viral defense system
MQTNNAQQMGLGILQRIAVREKAKMQALFLSRLYESPDSAQIALCGSMGLHGVYLHGRWSKDLDFEMLLEAAPRFQEIADGCGLTLGKPEDPVEFVNTLQYTFARPSAVYPEVAIAVEVFCKERIALPPERRLFAAVSGETVAVFVQPLAFMLATKVGCVFRRDKALDFFDLWLGLRSEPTTAYQVRDLLAQGLCEAGDFTPPVILDVDLALDKFRNIRAAWVDDLSAYMTAVPNFEQVYCDLSRWLSFLAEKPNKRKEQSNG